MLHRELTSKILETPKETEVLQVDNTSSHTSIYITTNKGKIELDKELTIKKILNFIAGFLSQNIGKPQIVLGEQLGSASFIINSIPVSVNLTSQVIKNFLTQEIAYNSMLLSYASMETVSEPFKHLLGTKVIFTDHKSRNELRAESIKTGKLVVPQGLCEIFIREFTVSYQAIDSMIKLQQSLSSFYLLADYVEVVIGEHKYLVEKSSVTSYYSTNAKLIIAYSVDTCERIKDTDILNLIQSKILLLNS